MPHGDHERRKVPEKHLELYPRVLYARVLRGLTAVSLALLPLARADLPIIVLEVLRKAVSRETVTDASDSELDSSRHVSVYRARAVPTRLS